MFKSKNTIIGALLIAALFLWATHNSEKQTTALQAEMKKQQAIEKAKQDSLKAIKGANATGTPELIAAPATAGVTGAAAGANQALTSPNNLSSPASLSSTAGGSDSAAPVVVAPRKIVVETDRFWFTLDNQGALVRSIVAKTLQSPEGKYPELIQDSEAGALSLKFDEMDLAKAVFSVDSTTPDTIKIENPFTLAFTWKNAQGQGVVREYRFTKDGNTVRQVSKVIGFKPKLYTLEWKGGMKETEVVPEGKSLMGGGYFFSEVVLNNSFNVERNTPTELTWFNREEGKATWVGLRRKYIAAIINWGGESEASIGADPIKLKEPDLGTYALTVSDNMASDSVAFDFVVLPLVHSEIATMGQSYEKIMFSGWEWLGADKWFVALCGYILVILNFFYKLIPNYGIAIILLTLLMKFVTMPLTVKQLRSTREMQRHKPAMDEIRLRNRATPQKVQKELMEYYAKNGVNPFAAMFGCLTMFLQMPVFIGLFVVLGRAVELRFAPFTAWVTDLSAPDVIIAAFKIPYIFPQGLTILPFVMAATTYFQTKQTITDPNQKMMIYMMPVMMLVFSTVMPSGLILYWIVSNLFSIVQFMIMNRGVVPVTVPVHHGKKK